MTKIVVTDATFPFLEAERTVAARHGADLIEANCKSEADVVAVAQDADVLLVQFAPVTQKAIDRLPPGAIIVRYGIGLDNIDLAAASQRGIKVAYVPDYATGEVADHTATLILAALRRITSLNESVRDGVWDAVGVAGDVKSFDETIVGFIGFGRIGREVHLRLRAFGFKSIVSDPYAEPKLLSSLGAEAADLDTMFSAADVITLHAPLNVETHHIVSGRRLAQMKPGAIIVNTARGGLIDSAALEEALNAGTLAAAALDVFEQEPLPASSGLRRCPNIILTPHVAWYSARAVDRLQTLAADEIDRHLSGRPPRCLIPGDIKPLRANA